MEPLTLVGLAGLTLIVAAWLVSLPAEPPPVRLSLTYFAGSVLLNFYAAALGDPVFTLLNGLAALLSLANAVRGLRRDQKRAGKAGHEVERVG